MFSVLILGVKKCACAIFYAFSMAAFMGFFSDVHSLMCPQMVCKQNFHFSLNVTYLKSLVLSQIGIFISGTETMICHLKREGLEVGVWDGNNFTVSLTILIFYLTYVKQMLNKC